MALEGFMYREPPEPMEVRTLLVRALVAVEETDIDAEVWTEVASGLAAAVVAMRSTTVLTGDEAEQAFRSAWCETYARRTNGDLDAAGDAYFPGEIVDAIHRLSLPRGVIREAARALADRAATRLRMYTANYGKD